MPVLMRDLLLEDVRRDDLFDWLGNLDNHILFLQQSTKKVEKKEEHELEIQIQAKFKTRTMGYIFEKKDDEHGGRRIRIRTTGKRNKGLLSYSLRTMKPSRNTMLTITWDYQAGSGLGMILNHISLQETHLKFMRLILENIEKNKKSIPIQS
jgi:hypothetical protein